MYLCTKRRTRPFNATQHTPIDPNFFTLRQTANNYTFKTVSFFKGGNFRSTSAVVTMRARLS